MVFICIPVFNRISHTLTCLESISKQTYKDYKVIVCDDGSTDGTSAILKNKFPQVKVIEGDGNLWWTGGTNECVKYALAIAGKNDYVFTLNNDTVLQADTLETLIRFSKSHQSSIVACGNFFIDDPHKLESTAFLQKEISPFSEYHRPLFPWGEDIRNLNEQVFQVSSVAGKGVLIPLGVFKTIGLYNATKFPHYHGDTEFSRRALKNGYAIYLNLNAVVLTDTSASGIGQVNSKVSLREFFSSFTSLRSENNLRILYNRSIIYHKRKWMIYLVPNVGYICIKFFKRYASSIKDRGIPLRVFFKVRESSLNQVTYEE